MRAQVSEQLTRLAPLKATGPQGLHLPQRCGQLSVAHSLTVPSSSTNSSYAVTVFPDGGAQCTCPGHHYRGSCKHAQMARSQVCSWQLGQGQDQSLKDNVSCTCPVCGGGTELV